MARKKKYYRQRVQRAAVAGEKYRTKSAFKNRPAAAPAKTRSVDVEKSTAPIADVTPEDVALEMALYLELEATSVGENTSPAKRTMSTSRQQQLAFKGLQGLSLEYGRCDRKDFHTMKRLQCADAIDKASMGWSIRSKRLFRQFVVDFFAAKEKRENISQAETPIQAVQAAEQQNNAVDESPRSENVEQTVNPAVNKAAEQQKSNVQEKSVRFEPPTAESMLSAIFNRYEALFC